MENTTLIKEVKKLRIDCNLDHRGSLETIASEIGVNSRSLSMALTAYRNGPGSRKILEKARAFLKSFAKSI